MKYEFSNIDYKKQLKDIIDHFGTYSQKVKAVEELAELQVAILHGNDVENIIEEIADVQIMIDQLKIIYRADLVVEKVMNEKINRTLTIMEMCTDE